MALATVYYIFEVRSARRDTTALVDSVRMRYGEPIRLSDLSSGRKDMLLAVEDPTFMCHHGVDLVTPGAGMTTITQGLVKMIYFPKGFKPGIAKIRQTLIAQYALDALVSKDEQLALFMNIGYMGNEDGRAIHGFADAAKTYFKRDFKELTDEEFLELVAMLIGPNAYKPHTPANKERVKRIHRYLSGEYRPTSLLDVDYNGKRHGTLAEEALIALLRIITDAKPNRVP